MPDNIDTPYNEDTYIDQTIRDNFYKGAPTVYTFNDALVLVGICIVLFIVFTNIPLNSTSFMVTIVLAYFVIAWDSSQSDKEQPKLL